MSLLFPDLEPIDDLPSGPKAEGPFAAVALENSIDKALDYSIPARLRTSITVGQRVRVPLGRNNKPSHGYVVEIHPTTAHPKIKPLIGIEDERVLVGPELMRLARWMARYYVAPLGTVLESIIPSAVKKKVGLGYTQMVRLTMPREEAQALLEKTRAPKRRAILARLLQLEPDEAIDLARLAGESGATPATVRKLTRIGLIRIIPQADLPGFAAEAPAAAGGEAPIALNEDQARVMNALRPRVVEGGFSMNLLHGVTGSGKTEIYLQCIAACVEKGRQAIVLVPEIALTPQTVRRFVARFQRVAVLHSGLSATERHRFWQRISTGQADVVVGARSAVFAPVPRLGMIVVDEEHESSYKQDQSPRYHARDIAVKRAQLEGVPALLGSATPSLETYRRANPAVDGPPPAPPSPYHYLSMPHRVRGLSLPHIEVVDMKVDSRFRRGVHLLSQRLEHMLRTTVAAGQQAILLLNRRGYSNFVYCPSCQHLMQCKYCDATMTYHRSAATDAHSARSSEGAHTGQLHCHYCLAVNPLPGKCPECSKKLSLFGLGTQRVEEEIARKFPDLKFARVDSDTMRNSRDYEALLNRFAAREIHMMLGTQMIAKGLDYPNVTLVGVISGDTALSLPDFRAAERTFQLITQVAGRAGRGDKPGRVILQTFMPEDPTIQAAIRQDYNGFARTELKHRRDTGLPPYERMVRIILRGEDQAKLHGLSEELASVLGDAIEMETETVRMKGPMPCAISRIAGYFRNQVILQARTPQPLQRVLSRVRAKGGFAASDRIAVDVDPVSLL